MAIDPGLLRRFEPFTKGWQNLLPTERKRYRTTDQDRQRHEMLTNVLCRLSPEIDPERVYAVVRKSCLDAERQNVVGRVTDQHRELYAEIGLVQKNLKIWLRRAKFIMNRLGRYPAADLIGKILGDSFFKMEPGPFPMRRSKIGRQPRPWIKQAHQDLSRAGITSLEDRIMLLQAVGLLPFHK